ncbi:hypothetical protein FOA52_001399 [Chlamydomonas sp. UWO 241]|nr:hypothetical protein FOA52_001399 [Chlamydomonas sp. UWO 241]
MRQQHRAARYFAYGSNMAPSVLTGRRGVTPKMSLPGSIAGYVLSFRLRGLPYVEPGFGTIEAAGMGDRGDVHGVVHAVSAAQWQSITRSEGVNRSTQYGYQVVRLACEMYDSSTVTVVTLQAAPASLVQGSSNGPLGVSGAVRPSGRYLSLVRTGAEHHGVAAEYRLWLGSLKAFDSDRLESRLGATATAGALTGGFALALPLALPLVPLALPLALLAASRLGGSGSRSSSGRSRSSSGGSGSSNGGGSSSVGGSSSSGAGSSSGGSGSRSSTGGSSGGGSGSSSGCRAASGGNDSSAQDDAGGALLGSASTAVWALHDWVLSPLFGSGR